MKLKIVKAYLDLVNQELPETHPVKYRNNKLDIQRIDTLSNIEICLSWYANFTRCLSSELPNYRFSQIYIEYSNGMAINYEWNETTNELERRMVLPQNSTSNPHKSVKMMRQDIKELYTKVNQLFKFKK